ncbi:MAG: DUF4143 domain-containing protein [Selenomonas sp.]|nr:DUF4143 domain-containing protein [Selenomonas sp.]
MKIPGYRPRVMDNIIENHLQAFGAVCIEGPKWCGKTWTSRKHSNSQIMIGDPAGNFQNRRLAQMDPSLVLPGETPRLIDEWQEVPGIWDAVRSEVDVRGKKGQFVLTGSSTPQRKGVMHSGAGRITPLRLRTMTLFETGDSDGSVSLSDLFRGELASRMTGDVALKTIAECIVRGGWPASLDVPTAQAGLLPLRYLDAILEDGANRLDGVQRDSSKMLKLLQSLARNESTTVSNKTLRRDIRDADGTDISDPTILSYLDVFRRLFVVDDQPPFSPNVRSSVRVKQMAKHHLADPSLSCALLGMNAEGLMGDLNTLGFLFEALCEHDLRIYAEVFGGKLFHYQDYQEKEIDAVVEAPNGEWGAFEIKLGANQIDAAAKSLLAIRKSIAKDEKGRMPKFLCVLCGLSNAAYLRPDGVMVVPLTSLRP